MLLHFHDPSKLKTKKVLFEESYHALDSDTLEQLKELSSKRKAVEDSINGSTFVAEAIAREISVGITSRYQQDLQKLECYLRLLGNLITHVDSIGKTPQMLRWTSDFVRSAVIFRKAAGVYDHLAKNVLPALQPFLPWDRPPEVTISMSSIMTLICLAEAQAVTVRKAEEKASSRSLLAKLHYGVSQLLIEAICVLDSKAEELKNVSDINLYLRFGKDYEDALGLVLDMKSRVFQDFISFSGTLHEARSRKYMAMDLHSSGRIGLAIRIIRHAISAMNKRLPNEETWQSAFEQEANSLREILQKFEQENEFVWHDKLPHMGKLPFLEGKKIVTAIAYTPVRLEQELVFKI